MNKQIKKAKLKTMSVNTRKPKKWILIDTEHLYNGSHGVYKFDTLMQVSNDELKHIEKSIKKLRKGGKI